MKINKFLTIFFVNLLWVNLCFAKNKELIWNDIKQDSIQINSPIEYIDTFDQYTVISPKNKIRLSDFGNIEKNKNGVKYTLKNYGVQVLNNGKIFKILDTTTPVKSKVDFNLIYQDKNIVAFRVRDNSVVDYVKKPFKSFLVNVYVYDLTLNKFSTIPVLNSESELDGKSLDLLQSDQVIFNAKKGIYTYIANIKYATSGKIGTFRVELNKSLKCVSASQGCDNIGILSAEIERKL